MMNNENNIQCNYIDENELYASYMPYVEHGGLFIATTDSYQLGHVVLLSVNLPGRSDSIDIAGNVVWLTPKGAHGGKGAGIGVQFNGDNKQYLNNEIETLLVGMLQSDKPTDTI